MEGRHPLAEISAYASDDVGYAYLKKKLKKMFTEMFFKESKMVLLWH